MDKKVIEWLNEIDMISQHFNFEVLSTIKQELSKLDKIEEVIGKAKLDTNNYWIKRVAMILKGDNK